MYLSNRDIRPTGYEAGEFLESPAYEPLVEPAPPPPDAEASPDEPGAP